jgi:hypothetical protein
LIAVMSSLTLVNSPRRSAWRLMIDKNTSIRLSHDVDVGEMQLNPVGAWPARFD